MPSLRDAFQDIKVIAGAALYIAYPGLGALALWIGDILELGRHEFLLGAFLYGIFAALHLPLIRKAERADGLAKAVNFRLGLMALPLGMSLVCIWAWMVS